MYSCYGEREGGTERETERQRGRQREREGGREGGRERERERERQEFETKASSLIEEGLSYKSRPIPQISVSSIFHTQQYQLIPIRNSLVT